MNINMRKEKILKILLFLFILLLVGLVIYVYINTSKNEQLKEDNENNKQNHIFFSTKDSEKLFDVNYVEDVIYNDIKYAKIALSMENNTEIDVRMNQYLFQITDENKEIINICYMSANSNLDFDEIFPAIVSAHSKVDGYIFCPLSDTNIKYLKMTYSLNPYEVDDNGNPFLKSYYFEISK